MNYRLDLDDWLARIPLEAEHDHFSAQIVTSPWHLCQNEHLRRAMQNEYAWGPAVPTDVFVMADGEPPDRHVTKIGGLPYRAASAAWPRLPGNIPLVFLAQINFCDSRDHTGALPGDLLLIFADDPCFPGFLQFEWQRLGLTGLVQAESVPAPSDEIERDALRRDKKRFGPIAVALSRMDLEIPDEIPHPTNSFEPCYGHLVRTMSFPIAVRRDRSERSQRFQGKEVWRDYWLLQYQATQIGAAPFFIQLSDSAALPGRVLCAVNSVSPEVYRPYPWVNHPMPLLPRGEWHLAKKYLMLGDTGCIYISRTDDGELHWHWSCF